MPVLVRNAALDCRGIVRAISVVSLVALAAACTSGDEIDVRDHARPGTGPRVVWDLGARPFPEIPLPNDVATFPDPTSPTGIRLNASMLAPGVYERALRQQVNELDGWGTFMPISVAFNEDIELQGIVQRHQRDEGDFRDDVMYLINLDTGIPIPLDLGNGSFPLTMREPAGFIPNDPRAGGSNLLLSTTDEDVNGDGRLDPFEDTNFDGVIQRASIFPRGTRPEDGLTTYWEAESRTLLARPQLPLEERTRYAVVITDRLRGANGPVRSAFDTIAHPAQLNDLRLVQQHLANAELSRRFYGGLAWSVASGAPEPANGRVAFAWTFRTQTTVTDMVDVHRGLHGEGRLASIARVQPDFRVAMARGGSSVCTPEQLANMFILPAAELQAMLREFLPQIGFSGAQGDALLASFDWVDYAAIATIQTPYLAGNPASPDPDARWHLDQLPQHPESVGTDEVQVWMFVPRAQPGIAAPFPVAFNAHGYGSGALQSIAFAGYFARFGIATLAANAPGHGNPLSLSQQSAVRVLLRSRCMGPFGDAVVAGRARDLNGDGEPDSGGDFLSAHVFHTRDMVRQTALDYMQLVRAITAPAWSQPGAVDYNRDGRMDSPGDLNGDGVPDFGGTRDGQQTPIFMWGESLGGITSMVLGAIDPAFTAVAPISGGAGLTDVTTRSNVGGVAGAVLMPTLGPVIVAVPAETRGPVGGRTRTACRSGDASVRWVVSDANRVGELEIACLRLGDRAEGVVPDDDWVALNLTTGLERCTRVPRDGRLFLPVAADRDDPFQITIYQGNVITDYGTCARPAGSPERTRIRQFKVGEGDCQDTCGHVPPNAAEGSLALLRAYGRMTQLRSPATGLGLRRQTGALRRFIQLAQAGIDAGDPVNFAPLFFLRPRTANPHPILTMTTIGDTDVPVSTGNTFARAAGILPFIRQPTGSTLDEFVSPGFLTERYQRTPNTVLVDNFVIEGISRLERHPVLMSRRYLFDPDDLDEGRQQFHEAELDPPMRLVRAARPLRPGSSPVTLAAPEGADAAISSVWRPRAGEPLAAFINAYIRPEGVHTFYPSDPSDAWDNGAYYTNLVARFFQSGGTDVVYYTRPTGHQCLEDASCDFIPR